MLNCNNNKNEKGAGALICLNMYVCMCVCVCKKHIYHFDEKKDFKINFYGAISYSSTRFDYDYASSRNIAITSALTTIAVTSE